MTRAGVIPGSSADLLAAPVSLAHSSGRGAHHARHEDADVDQQTLAWVRRMLAGRGKFSDAEVLAIARRADLNRLLAAVVGDGHVRLDHRHSCGLPGCGWRDRPHRQAEHREVGPGPVTVGSGKDRVRVTQLMRPDNVARRGLR